MPIRFDRARWERVKRTYAAWWSGELDRPLFHIALHGCDAGRPEPALPYRGSETFYADSVSAEEIVDRWDWDLSRNVWVGDGFPCLWPNFGPGVLAPMLGGRLRATPETQTVWFDMPDDWCGVPKEIGEIDFEWDPDNYWVRRIGDIERAAMDRWDGLVQVGMTDLGGTVDVLSSFRPGKHLLLDLVDHPDEVKRLTWRLHEMWWRAFDHLNSILQPKNPGYTAWTPIFCETPYYMVQCDFCYMIGPRMFREFVMPELAATCRRLGNPFYHLDGPGQLPHLDSLLEIEDLKGIQWVPGAVGPMHDQWPDLHRRVHEAGKLIQIGHRRTDDGRWDVDAVAEQIGSTRGIIAMGRAGIEEEDEVMRLLERYGAM